MDDHAHGPIDPTFQLLTNMAADIARMDERTQSMEASVNEMQRTLRGHNGTPGMVANVQRVTEDVAALKEAHQLTVAAGETDAVWTCRPVQQLAKEHAALKKRVEDYPTYFWLLRNKTKPTLAWTLGMISMAIIFFAPLADPELGKLLWYKATTVIFKLLGLPTDLLP